MNDEQFEAAMDYLGDEGQVSITQQLRARDTAQREALARVEAERDSVQIDAMTYAEQRDIAQAQLAEAVGLLETVANTLGRPVPYPYIKAFLARNAKAEQRELQGAQAEDERVALLERELDRERERGDMAEVELQHARAALATQPAAGEPLTVWYGSMPESNGKTNWTAILYRKGDGLFDGPHLTIARSEYPDRVRYEADQVRHIIGELAEEPDILAYDADAHSGYTAPPAAAHGASEEHRNQMADTIVSLRTEIAALRRNAAAHGDEAVRKDAARYQWLRSKSSGLALTVVANHSGTDLDSEIDAAMRAQGDGEVQ